MSRVMIDSETPAHQQALQLQSIRQTKDISKQSFHLATHKLCDKSETRSQARSRH